MIVFSRDQLFELFDKIKNNFNDALYDDKLIVDQIIKHIKREFSSFFSISFFDCAIDSDVETVINKLLLCMENLILGSDNIMHSFISDAIDYDIDIYQYNFLVRSVILDAIMLITGFNN